MTRYDPFTCTFEKCRYQNWLDHVRTLIIKHEQVRSFYSSDKRSGFFSAGFHDTLIICYNTSYNIKRTVVIVVERANHEMWATVRRNKNKKGKYAPIDILYSTWHNIYASFFLVPWLVSPFPPIRYRPSLLDENSPPPIISTVYTIKNSVVRAPHTHTHSRYSQTFLTAGLKTNTKIHFASNTFVIKTIG